MRTKQNSLNVLSELINRAECLRSISRTVDYAFKNERERIEDSKAVGQLVLRSSDSDRELLQQLTSNDVASVKWPRWDYVHYITGPEDKMKFIPDPNYRHGRKRAVCVSLS